MEQQTPVQTFTENIYVDMCSNNMETDSAHKCSVCDKIFSAIHNVRRHLRDVHGIDPNTLTNKENQKTPTNTVLECHLCKKTFSSQRNVRRHVAVVHAKECHLCKKTFSSPKNVRRHVATVHATNRTPSGINKAVACKRPTCGTCNRLFPNNRLLAVHKRRAHREVVKLTCCLCKAIFCSARTMALHFGSAHELLMKRLGFSSFGAFHTWRCKEEKESMCKYKQSNQYKTDSCSVLLFMCDGAVSDKNSPRGSKMQPKKSEVSCPSFMEARIGKDYVEVYFVGTHMFHENNTQDDESKPQKVVKSAKSLIENFSEELEIGDVSAIKKEDNNGIENVALIDNSCNDSDPLLQEQQKCEAVSNMVVKIDTPRNKHRDNSSIQSIERFCSRRGTCNARPDIEDYDLHFILSLLPHFKKVRPERKLAVQIKLQQILLEEDEQTGNNAGYEVITYVPEPTNCELTPSTRRMDSVVEHVTSSEPEEQIKFSDYCGSYTVMMDVTN